MSGLSKQFEVIVAGDLFVDIVMTGFAEWPAPGQEAFAKAMVREAGGGAAITANGLARLGASTAVVGVVDDGWLTQRLASFDVDISMMERHSTEPAGLTVSVSSGSSRTFFTYMGANKDLPELLTRNDIRARLQNAQHVHFACCLDAFLLADLTDFLHSAETRVSLDVGWHPDWLGNEKSMRAVSKLDLFMPNEGEAEVITGKAEPAEILDAFERMGLRRVALKLGEQGSALLFNGKRISTGPVKVEVVDTTGAGDCFDAGFIYGMLQGESPEGCLEIGNLCGALSTRSLGGIASFPSRAEIFK